MNLWAVLKASEKITVLYQVFATVNMVNAVLWPFELGGI